MKDTFTSQQREIVARKMGYEGPMSMFDTFLNASADDAQKYASITDKYVQRMANGGSVVKMYTGGEIASYIANIQASGGGDKEIAAAMNQYGVSPSQVAAATGTNVAEVQSRYEAATAPAPVTTTSTSTTTAAPSTKTSTTTPVAQTTTTPAVMTAAAAAVPTPTGQYTDADIVGYIKNIQKAGGSNADIAQAMDKFKVDPSKVASAFVGQENAPSLVEIQAAYNKVNPTGAYSTLNAAEKAIAVSNTQLQQQLATAQADKAAAEAALAAAQDEAARAAAQARLDEANKILTTAQKAIDVGASPTAGTASAITPSLNTATTEQKLATQLAPTTATTATQTLAAPAATAAAPTATPAAQMAATTAATGVTAEMGKLTAAQGTVSPNAQVTAAQQEPTTTALAGLQGAQLDAAQQAALQTRTAQAGEMVSGSAVDQARVEAELAKNVAAQATVTEDMTVQGQLAKLTANFDASNPPAWAAGSLRAATAQMAARGLSASSMAGQAIVQAALEAATPVAAADAKVFQDMGLANLSNRQQMAVLTAQQRATFMGQEFDQNFQTKVLNAAKVSDIANQNFSAAQQVALENARLAQSVDLANLSNDQAIVMAKAAEMATLETANLNNRQQAAVANAQSFLQMDMANLSNEQQTALFKSQQISTALLSDAAAENAAKQFNATSTNQTNQFFAGLTTQVAQFNATQTNAINQFNTDQANAIAKFNADVQNQRDAFNAQNRLVIDQSNAQWLREISTANTAATNAANTANAQLSQQMTLAEYNNLIQLYRDKLTFTWQSAQNDLDRATKISTANISGSATVDAASTAAEGQMMNTAVSAAAVYALSLSDENAKDITGVVTNPLLKIKSLTGYTYTYKQGFEKYGYPSDTEMSGVLAGEVQKVIPSAITPFAHDTSFRTVNYADITAMLIEAVKELSGTVDSLSAKLATLEAK